MKENIITLIVVSLIGLIAVLLGLCRGCKDKQTEIMKQELVVLRKIAQGDSQ